eukprot:Seg586.10 transcript_id=Seg586.10/GoldUCD/mRNA.D3Y31 product="2-hydroxyacylsphingosine 1-beta-galactosyltransferase" protein_id=Seg586.10/GoldUCD/D3Y31
MLPILLLMNMVLPLLSERVLLLPFPWPSHYTQLEKIGVELTKRNHEVFIITSTTEKYRCDPSLHKIEYYIPTLRNNTFVSIAENRLESGSGFGINWLVEYVKLLEEFGHALLEDQVISQLAKNADIVISDTAFLLAPIFADHHKLPLVFLSPFGHLPGCMADTLGNIENPSYVPTFVSTSLFERIGLPQKMNFLQRSFNLMSNIISKILRDMVTVPLLRPLTRKYSSKTILELWQKTALVLIPMDYSVEYPRPELPHVKMIGPLTTEDSKSPIPKSFGKILHNSKSGVIVVSFGITSRLNSYDAFRILEGLVRTGYTIIWKYNTEKISALLNKYDPQNQRFPVSRQQIICQSKTEECQFCENQAKTVNRSIKCTTLCNKTTCQVESNIFKIGKQVHVFNWLPQQRLLQHSKTKLLITHCGLNSLYEALYHNTKVLCIPLFGEQFDNAGRVVSRGIGKAITLADLTANSLKENILQLITDKTYAVNVGKVSRRLRRSKQSPVETAAYWVEYVLAEKGDMTFLRPPQLPYHVYFSVDIIIIWGLLILFVPSWVLYKLTSVESRPIFSK